MRWTSMSSDREVPSLNTPVLVLDSPVSEFARAMFGDSRKRKLEDDFVSEAAFVGETPAAAEVQMSPSKSERLTDSSSKKKKKKEWLSLQMQRAILADEDGDRAIHIAVAQENVPLVRQLCFLMKRAKVSLDVANHLKQTALHVSVLVGNDAILNILLTSGASVHLRDKRGNTPLQLAIKYFNPVADKGQKLLNSLLAHPNIKSTLDCTDYQGLSVLHDAVSRKNSTAVRELCRAGADVNVADGKSGRTALACAVLAGDIQMVQLLLQHGACAERQDYGGLSSLDLALQTGDKSLIRTLEKKLNSFTNKYTSFSECPPNRPKREISKNTDIKTKNDKTYGKAKRKCNKAS